MSHPSSLYSVLRPLKKDILLPFPPLFQAFCLLLALHACPSTKNFDDQVQITLHALGCIACIDPFYCLWCLLVYII